MGSFYTELTDKQIEFVRAQHMFFVATAHATGRVNLSPKGMDTFRVLNAHEVAYLDMGGSGNETCAHLQNDGRITIMFCAFDQNPNITRIYGRGKVYRPGSPEWDGLIPNFAEIYGQRQLIHVTVESTQDSCGYAVPRYTFKEERETLRKYAGRLAPEEMAEKYAAQTKSIDGLPVEPWQTA